ncbi:hypothetical protein PGTUg99_030165 [Puccinia graminis f. sp. tritici]|uniref:Uncharacterized protein n=1 Tax=Puccinia graminis f. sp. tritici TaxID=56615 RepID=A0A5B0SP56_PUCGR|nr:hypothetical protein PGTUg99_030165 [Puccinia graminis f. sp. tritici]
MVERMWLAVIVQLKLKHSGVLPIPGCCIGALQDNDSDVMALSSTTSYRCTFEIPQAVLELVPFVLSVPRLLAPAQVMEN